MGTGGLFIALIVVIVCLYLLPARIDRARAVAQSREGDRFSSDLRVLNTGSHGVSAHNDTDMVQAGPSPEPALLARPKSRAQAAGGAMDGQEHVARRPSLGARSARREIARAHRLAELRSRRAARLARERSAGRRRFVTAMVGVALVAAAAAGAGLGWFAWAWVGAPGVFLAGSLVSSRVAAKHSAALSARERAAMAAIVRGEAPRAGEGIRQADFAPSTRAPAAKPARDQAHHGRAAGRDGHATSGAEAVGATAPETGAPETVDVEAPSAHAPASADAPRAAEADSSQAGQGGLSWKVTPVPPPSYAAKAHVSGREVHADTDIRGIPEVQAHEVPARPSHASEPRGQVRSSEDVADQALQFDLDAVLQARREDDTGAIPITRAVGLGGLHEHTDQQSS